MALSTVQFPDYNNNPQQIPTLPQAPAVAANSISVALNSDYGSLKTLANQTAATTTPISGTFATPATVTITIAVPGVITLATHGFLVGTAVVFETSDTLPTGITAGTTYYVSSLGLATNSFEVSTTYANAVNGVSITTSGSQNGTHTVQSLQSAPIAIVGGRNANVTISGSFSATVQLKRYFNSTLGWVPISVNGSVVYSYTATASEQFKDDQFGVLYSLFCTYASGTVNYLLSQ